MRFAASVILTVSLLTSSFSAECQTLNFSGKEVPLQEIFSVIKKQTGILFFYDAALLRSATALTVEWKNVSLEEALNETFKHQPFTWVLEDKTVTIIRKPLTSIQAAPRPPPPLTIRVKGTIIDDEGSPVPGATVIIKGTKRGIVSDSAGKFSITTSQKTVLVFSSVNHSAKEVRVEREEMNIELKQHVKPMESLLVGGNFSAIKRKAIATSVTVLDSRTLEKIPGNTLDQVFRGWVPGTNSFNIGDYPEGFPSVTIRGAQGANSLSTIAVYIDGIEYAGGSGYLSQLDKTNIDRIEIVRGPGAATMYGTGSNGGIVQIFTKRTVPGQNSVNLTTSAGFYKSKWVKNDPFQQMHKLETTNSYKDVVIKLGGSYRTVNEYLPEGGEKNKGFYSGANYARGKWQANLTAHYYARNFHISRDPIYDTAIHPRTDIIIETRPGITMPAYLALGTTPRPSTNKDASTETFVSALNLSYKSSNLWIHRLDAGYTSNTNREVPRVDGYSSFPVTLAFASAEYNVTTVRYSNVLNVYGSDDLAAVLTSGIEYKKYSVKRTLIRSAATNGVVSRDPPNENYGAFVQAAPSYKNLFLTLGLRFEKNSLFSATLNPRIGFTTNFDIGSFTVKPRVSWGKGIASPTYSQRFGVPASNFSVTYANPDLKPQSQQGADYGLELYGKKGTYRLEAVYYDNQLQDMITTIQVTPLPENAGLNAFMYANVGKVANRGWEFSGEYKTGPFSISGTYSIMSSTIVDTSGTSTIARFRGKAPGTRLLFLPKQTAGLEVGYTFLKLFGKADKGLISFNVTEVGGVRSSDYPTWALDVAYGRIPYDPAKTGYDVETPAVYRLGLYAEYSINNELRFFTQGANILNSYQYELINDSGTHGATWLFGFRYNYSRSKE